MEFEPIEVIEQATSEDRENRNYLQLPEANHNRAKLEQIFTFYDEGADVIKKNMREKKESIPVRHFTPKEVAEMLTKNLRAKVSDAEARGQKFEPNFRVLLDTDKAPMVSTSQIASWVRSAKFSEANKGDNNRAMGWTLKQIQDLREHLGISPYQENCITVAIQNQKGGCWKTATTVNIGDDLGTRGYRVVVIDIDPQASYTLQRGYIPDLDVDDEETIYPFIIGARDPSEIIQVVRTSRNPNVDFIPGCLAVATSAETFGAQYQVILSNLGQRAGTNEDGTLFTDQDGNPVIDEQANDELYQLYTRLDSCLVYLRDHYDVILIDGTPFLGVLAANILCASEFCLTPCPTEIPDFASTNKFVGMVGKLFDDALGLGLNDLNVPTVVVVPTRFSSNPTNLMNEIHQNIQHVFTDPKTKARHCLHPAVEKHDQVVGKTFDRNASAFDLAVKSNKRFEIDKRSIERAVANLSLVTDDFLNTSLIPLWRIWAKEQGDDAEIKVLEASHKEGQA